MRCKPNTRSPPLLNITQNRPRRLRQPQAADPLRSQQLISNQQNQNNIACTHLSLGVMNSRAHKSLLLCRRAFGGRAGGGGIARASRSANSIA